MIRDFQIPHSLILQLSNAPTPIFFTSYTLDALPQLNGSVSYITTSEVLERVRLVVSSYLIHEPMTDNSDRTVSKHTIPICR